MLLNRHRNAPMKIKMSGYIAAAIFFISCNQLPGIGTHIPQIPNVHDPVISNEKLDSVKTKKYEVTAKPDLFETAFFEGTTTISHSLQLSFFAVDIGKLNIESGKMIACDPIMMHAAEPFVQQFPVGRFPVQLAIAKIKTDERVAFSRILFSEEPVAKWEFALLPGQKQAPLDDTSFYGYGVDAGLGLFIDEKSNEAFNVIANKDQTMWTYAFITRPDQHYRATWQYSLFNFDDHSLACFSTGWGDGHYGTYVGYDAKGNICRLLTDFGLIGWWEKKS